MKKIHSRNSGRESEASILGNGREREFPLTPVLLFLYQTQHKQYLSIENGSLVNRWKLALMVFQLLLLFLYQTQHKQYLSIENGTLVNRRKFAFMMLQPLLLFLYQTQTTISLDCKWNTGQSLAGPSTLWREADCWANTI